MSFAKISAQVVSGALLEEAACQTEVGGVAYSTRTRAAMRHAGNDLRQQLTHRRLLLVVTDGEPSDIDVTDQNYLVEDAQHVVHELALDGIDVFCVGLDFGGDSYLTRIFGRRNVVQIDRLERLPEKLPMLYFSLTAKLMITGGVLMQRKRYF